MMGNKIFARLLAERVAPHCYRVLRLGVALLCWAELGEAHRLFDERALPLWALLWFWLSTAAMIIGRWPRLSTLSTALYLGVLVYGFGGGFASHRVTLLCHAALLLSLAREGEESPAWPLYLLRLQLAVVYAFGALDKMSPAFLSGERLDQILSAQYPEHSLLASDGWLVWLMPALSVGAMLFEWSLAFGLWFEGARRLLLPAALLFHLALYLVLPVYTFSALSALLLLSFAPATLGGLVGEARLSVTQGAQRPLSGWSAEEPLA